MKFSIFPLLLSLLLLPPANKEHYLIIGTYDSPKSEGVYVYKFNSDDGSSREISHVKASNPSFVTISPNQKNVYAVYENARDGDGGEVAAFTFNKATGTLSLINQQRSGGDHPCYITIDKTGKWVIIANYTSGTLSVVPVKANGGLGKATTVIHDHGSGKDPARQEGPHVHSTVLSADNRWLFVADLGIDKEMVYAFNAATGKLTPAKKPFVAAEAGSGPRHFIFHPNNKYAYLVEELSGTVEAYKYSNGVLTQMQRISTLPANDTSFAGSADIHISPDAKFLYASNRGGSNTIVIYAINATTGKLTLVGHQSTLGIAPRNFTIDPSGNFLLVGNQNSDEIVIFKRDRQTGLLSDSGKRINVGKPVCLKWANADY
jgi:6-phosphogluconolactonase